jgi:hypothetical protein
MKKLHEKGFTVAEGLLLFVIVAMIGGTGYYVYSRIVNDDSSKPSGDTSQVDNKSEDTPEADVTAGWLLFAAPNGKYKIKLADGWVLQTFNGESYLYNFDNELAIVPGKTATVSDITGGRDYYKGLVMGFTSKEHLGDWSLRGDKQAPLKTIDGRTIDVYHFVQDNPEPMLDVPYKGQEYTYVVTADNGSFIVRYSFAPEDTDHHAVVEKVVKTVQVL